MRSIAMNGAEADQVAAAAADLDEGLDLVVANAGQRDPCAPRRHDQEARSHRPRRRDGPAPGRPAPGRSAHAATTSSPDSYRRRRPRPSPPPRAAPAAASGETRPAAAAASRSSCRAPRSPASAAARAPVGTRSRAGAAPCEMAAVLCASRRLVAGTLRKHLVDSSWLSSRGGVAVSHVPFALSSREASFTLIRRQLSAVGFPLSSGCGLHFARW